MTSYVKKRKRRSKNQTKTKDSPKCLCQTQSVPKLPSNISLKNPGKRHRDSKDPKESSLKSVVPPGFEIGH